MEYEGKEVFFKRNDLIVSKTDTKGIITYANHTFLDIAGYTEAEVIGQSHNIIRHPNMPRGVFEVFWETLKQGREIFAYVVNATKNGDHYWVIAHVTPSYLQGQVIGYHSTRRVPDGSVIKSVIEPLYDDLNRLERGIENRKQAIAASTDRLAEILSKRRATYDEFISELMLGRVVA